MKRKLGAALAVLACGVMFVRMAMAFDVNAGPIWSNADAQTKCPVVCRGLQWNGQWTTTVPGQMSVCGTVQGVDVPVGPIWNNDDAREKCPSQIGRVTWSGQWTTTVWGKMSVCGCNPPPPVR
ncbi:MAG: mannan-binding lectin [Minicystis sp.]